MTRSLFAPLLSNKDPLLFLVTKLLLPSEYVAGAVRFGSSVEVVERVRELVFSSPVFVLMKRSSVLGESDDTFSSVAFLVVIVVVVIVVVVVAVVLLLLFFFVAP